MKYDLIFYLAKKTGYCEKRLIKTMKQIGAEPNRIVSAASPSALGEETTHSLRLVPLVVIVGGLGSTDDDNLATVLSRVLSNSTLTLDNIRRLPAPDSEEGDPAGYIIRYKSQMILALPDNPDAIEGLLTDDLLAYIREKAGK